MLCVHARMFVCGWLCVCVCCVCVWVVVYMCVCECVYTCTHVLVHVNRYASMCVIVYN